MNYRYLILCTFLSCGSSIETPYNGTNTIPSYNVKYFGAWHKLCTPTQCTTYVRSVVDITNPLDYPINLSLKCDYYHNDTLSRSITSRVFFIGGRRKIEVQNELMFTNHPDEASFLSVDCELMEG